MESSVSELTKATVNSFFGLLLLHYALCCFWNTGFQKLWNTNPFICVLLALALGVAAKALFRSFVKYLRKALHSKICLGLGFFGVLFLYFLMVFYSNPQMASDFATYWQAGKDLTLGKAETTYLHTIRSIPYTAIVQLLFGDSIMWLRLINLSLVSISAYFFYYHCRQTLPTGTAILASFFFLLWPDLPLAAGLPSHDIPTLFWFSLLLCNFSVTRSKVLQHKPLQAMAFSILLGATVFILELQRSYGILILPGLLLSSFLIQPSTRRSTIVHFFLVPLLSYFALSTAFHSTYAQKIPDSDPTNVTALLTSIDTTATGVYTDSLKWRQLYRQVPAKLRRDLVGRKLLTEILERPLALFSYYARRNQFLAMTDDYSIYHERLWKNKLHLGIVTYIASWFTGLLALCSGLQLLSDGSRKCSDSTWFLVSISLSIYSAIWLVGEIAARYDIFLAFCLSQLAAQYILKERQVELQKTPFILAGALLFTGIAVLFLAGRIAGKADMLLLDQRTLSSDIASGGLRLDLRKPRATTVRVADISLLPEATASWHLDAPVDERQLSSLTFALIPQTDKSKWLSGYKGPRDELEFIFEIKNNDTVLLHKQMKQGDAPVFEEIDCSLLPAQDGIVRFDFIVKIPHPADSARFLKDNEPILSIEYVNVQTHE